MIATELLFDLSHTLAAEYIAGFTFPWQSLGSLRSFIIHLGGRLKGYKVLSDGIWVHESAKISSSAYISAPCIIGERSEVRNGAYIRGSVLVGNDCVVGNSTELKNSILFDRVQAPHYNYIGDSILGFGAHMGAGSVTSNVKSDKREICVRDKTPIYTGLYKLGAMLGDSVEIGCNAVLNPGTVIGRRTSVYPLTSVRGVIEGDCIVKGTGVIVKKIIDG